MAKVIICNGLEDKIIEGKYQYVEGGFDDKEKLKPGFHISAGPFTVYLAFDSREEFRKFIEDLKEQIPVFE